MRSSKRVHGRGRTRRKSRGDQHPPLHERVVQQVVQEIVNGTFAPGETLPTEPDLVQRFGVSRTVVREAMRIVASKGLVAVRQGSGMWVQPSSQWVHLDPLVIFEQVRSGRDGALLDELIEMRRVLETEIAALAAERRTDDDLRAIEHALEAMEVARHDPEEYTRQDRVFHDSLLDAARNRLLREALRPVAGALQAGRFIAVARENVIERSFPSHQAIFAAVAAGDVEGARETMRQHIVQFETDVRSSLGATPLVDSRPDETTSPGVLATGTIDRSPGEDAFKETLVAGM